MPDSIIRFDSITESISFNCSPRASGHIMYQPLAQKEVIANQAKKIYELEQALATAKARNYNQPRWQTYQEDKSTTDRFLACTLAFMALSAVLLLSDHSSLTALRTLSINLGGGQCLWTKAVALPADADVPRTLLVSYPGSGKRYVWRAVEGLTGFRVGDGKLLRSLEVVPSVGSI